MGLLDVVSRRNNVKRFYASMGGRMGWEVQFLTLIWDNLIELNLLSYILGATTRPSVLKRNRPRPIYGCFLYNGINKWIITLPPALQIIQVGADGMAVFLAVLDWIDSSISCQNLARTRGDWGG